MLADFPDWLRLISMWHTLELEKPIACHRGACSEPDTMNGRLREVSADNPPSASRNRLARHHEATSNLERGERGEATQRFHPLVCHVRAPAREPVIIG
eukprot:7478505-Pyramimonas_sp.AAC.1